MTDLRQIMDNVQELEKRFDSIRARRDADTYGWNTTKTAEGYKWTVYEYTHGEGQKELHKGVENSRDKAVAQAKKHVIGYRRQK